MRHLEGAAVGLEDLGEGRGDVYPLVVPGQKVAHQLMMTLAAREEVSPADELQHLGCEVLIAVICYTYDYEFHTFIPSIVNGSAQPIVKVEDLDEVNYKL